MLFNLGYTLKLHNQIKEAFVLYHTQWAASRSLDEIRCIHEALFGWEYNEFTSVNFQGSLVASFIQRQSGHEYHTKDFSRNNDIDMILGDFLVQLYVGRFPSKPAPSEFKNSSRLYDDLFFTEKDAEKLFFIVATIYKLQNTAMPDRWWRLTVSDLKKELAKKQFRYFLGN